MPYPCPGPLGVARGDTPERSWQPDEPGATPATVYAFGGFAGFWCVADFWT